MNEPKQKHRNFGYTLGDRHPEVYRLADKYIPGVWGSLREAWMKGHLQLQIKLIRGTPYEKYYKKGKEARRDEQSGGRDDQGH